MKVKSEKMAGREKCHGKTVKDWRQYHKRGHRKYQEEGFGERTGKRGLREKSLC